MVSVVTYNEKTYKKDTTRMKKVWTILAIFAGIAVIFGLSLSSSYNGLVFKQENVQTALANLDSQYQRRADLIPNLVSTVKGASDFEQETLTQVVEARAKATSITLDVNNATPEQIAAYQSAQGELSQTLGRLLALAESYPDLKAVETYRDLLSQLEGTENRIAVARQDYNDAVNIFNKAVKRFPTNIVANLFGFEEATYFAADEGASFAPTVDFGE